MCYALPGPRCSSHTKSAMDKARKEYDENPTQENKDALKSAINKYLETPDGIEYLKRKGKTKEANAMERIRQRRLDAYHAANGSKTRAKADPGGLNDKLALANNPETSTDVVLKLKKDKNPKVRNAIASSTMNPDVLTLLSDDTDHKVVLTVASNEATRTDDLENMFRRHEATASVVGAIAKNPKCPASVYAHIVAQPYPDFSRVIAFKPDCPEEVLNAIAGAEHWSARKAAAESPHATESILRSLSQDPDAPVRRAVALNPLTPSSVLEQLRDEETEWQVQSAVQSVLTQRSS
jgi:hypothetical protein